MSRWEPGVPLFHESGLGALRPIFEVIDDSEKREAFWRAQARFPRSSTLYFAVCLDCLVSWVPAESGTRCWNCGR